MLKVELTFSYSYLAVLAESKYINKINVNNKGVKLGLYFIWKFIRKLGLYFIWKFTRKLGSKLYYEIY